MKSLDLRANKLSGPIPASLGNLSNLVVLKLAYNQLSGPIPSSLGNLSNLTDLWLYYNELSGPIPSSLGNLSNLRALLLNNNQLSGPIPSSLGNLTNVSELSLYNNQLSGPIPSSLSNLTNLGGGLWLHSNHLCGYLPKSFMFQWPNGIPYPYAVASNKLMISGYDPAMTNWLQTTNFKFGNQQSTDCGTEKQGDDKS